MRDFNRFFNSILENPLLRSNEVIEDFLTKNQEVFHFIKLKYKNYSKLVNLPDFRTLNGELDVTCYNNKLQPNYISQNIDNKRNILKEINTNLKKVMTAVKYLDVTLVLLCYLKIRKKDLGYICRKFFFTKNG